MQCACVYFFLHFPLWLSGCLALSPSSATTNEAFFRLDCKRPALTRSLLLTALDTGGCSTMHPSLLGMLGSEVRSGLPCACRLQQASCKRPCAHCVKRLPASSLKMHEQRIGRQYTDMLVRTPCYSLLLSQATRSQAAPPPSAIMPPPNQPGFWNSIFGNQPYGMTSSQAIPPFAFGTGSAPPLPYGSGSAAFNNVPHMQEQPQRQQSGHSSNGQREGSSNNEHSTSPDLPNGKAAGSRKSSAAEERLKKTRKRQQTSCSECHRRKQKCNQVRRGPYCHNGTKLADIPGKLNSKYHAIDA